MDSTSFCYWLQGFFEMTETNKLSEKQVLMVKEHLKLVFNKVTPELKGTSPPELTKQDLDKALDRAGRLPKSWSTTRSPKLC